MKLFFCRARTAEISALPPDGKNRIGWRAWVRRGGWAVFAGLLAAAAFPPLEWSALMFAALLPLILTVLPLRAGAAAVCGFLYGLAWALPGFFFLREIHPAIPFLLAPVLALWPMMFAALVPGLYRAICVPQKVRLAGYDAVEAYRTGFSRELMFLWSISALWCVLDWTRGTMLPWNFPAASQWRNPALLQIAAWTGAYGITFLIVWVNGALALSMRQGQTACRKGKIPRPWGALAALCALGAAGVFGGVRLLGDFRFGEELQKRRIGFVQGDISQRRSAGPSRAQEALDIYLKTTQDLLSAHPETEIVLWPETAVPYPFYGTGEVSAHYRAGIFELVNGKKTPMLIGTLDFTLLDGGAEYGLTNAALLFTPPGVPAGKYEKVHRVPFGEYVPFGKNLPDSVRRKFDMGRDLTPGKSFMPLEILPGVRAGIAICFESVFSSIAREEALRGANLLIVLSNDAWYPLSSEPVQHLANGVLRSVETGLPSLRCGNNGAGALISRKGVVRGLLSDDFLKRERGFGIAEIPVEPEPVPTFHTRFGEVFVFLCWAGVLIALCAEFLRERAFCRAIAGKQGEPPEQRL